MQTDTTVGSCLPRSITASEPQDSRRVTPSGMRALCAAAAQRNSLISASDAANGLA